jgi:hypothetical protein
LLDYAWFHVFGCWKVNVRIWWAKILV